MAIKARANIRGTCAIAEKVPERSGIAFALETTVTEGGTPLDICLTKS